MLRSVAVALCSLVVSSSAFAQIMYEPVRSQYTASDGSVYYYGGTDPRVHQLANYGNCPRYGYANNLHRFDGGNSFGQPSPLYDRTPVYTDCAPGQDVSRLGYTAADAENEARANAPRYFTKSAILTMAQPQTDGSWVVPASAGGAYIVPLSPAPYRGTTAPTATMINPAKRGQIIIIPKSFLDRPVKDFEKKAEKVASAAGPTQ
jgi:hypothetical protein